MHRPKRQQSLMLRPPEAATLRVGQRAMQTSPRPGDGGATPRVNRLGERERRSGSRSSGGLVFWLLVSMSFSVLAACVIVPEWRHLKLLAGDREGQQRRVDSLEESIDHQKRLLRALRTDPTVIQRLAQRDRSPHGRAVRTVAAKARPFTPLSETRIDGSTRTGPGHEKSATLLFGYDLAELFCDKQARPALIVLSTALLAVAFCLFCRHPANDSVGRVLDGT